MTNTHSEMRNDEVSIRVGSPRLSDLEKFPDYMRAPEGMTQEMHEINLLITTISIGAHASYRWLRGDLPNTEAARRTSMRLCTQLKRLAALVEHFDAVEN
jgi:hypothetical protein